MPTITEEEYRRRVNKFLEAHAGEYTERELCYLRKNATWGIKVRTGFGITDILRQIYAEVGLLEENQDMYAGFLELLAEKFDIDRNIVEVAGGVIPTLSKKIALRQKTGTITVYDPRIIKTVEKPDNMFIKRQMFNKNTPITNAQMIIGFMPCDVTNDIIESACRNNIDFMIALCEGGSRSGYEWLEDDEEWIAHVKYNARRHMRKTDLGTLEEASLIQFGNPYPVIYNKRK